MRLSFFSYICVALAVMIAGASLISCSKDEVIEQKPAPEIVIDSETGIYNVKVGEELSITPTYKNVSGNDVQYSWTIDEVKVDNTPVLKRVWDTPGRYYVTVSVITSAGTCTEELRVDVEVPAAPVISLPIDDGGIVIAVGTRYMITPEVSNNNVPGFKVSWMIDGKVVGNEIYFEFDASVIGVYKLIVTASNDDGSDTKELLVNVVDKLPYELSFVASSIFAESTDRFTFPGRPVYLSPVANGFAPVSWKWSVNGVDVDCHDAAYMFTPKTAGDYLVSVTADDMVVASVLVVCVDADENTRYRAATASSSPESNKVFEWVPAPGQFIGETVTGGMTGNETTLDSANDWASKRLKDNAFVSLGGFGGYIVVGFDHSIVKSEVEYDFVVKANAFLNAMTGDGGSNEPGIVYVMQDVNGNGLPDDEWYELRGSETGKAGTRQDYAVTYYRPSAPKMSVQWTDNFGASGTVDYLDDYHNQNYYYPAWIKSDSYTLRGTCLEARTTQDQSTGLWDNWPFDWGYADNFGSDNRAGGDSVVGQHNGFCIRNAMLGDLSAIDLQYIDFIKVQTGVNSKAGWLGEVSTEVLGFVDLNMFK